MSEEDYEDVIIESDRISEAHDVIDGMQNRSSIDDDDVRLPERFDVAYEKWLKSADIAQDQQVNFEKNKSFFGSHVANGNILRSDNPHHMMNMEVANMYDRFVLFRDHANFIRQEDVQEHMLCRGGPEYGGFDRKMDRSVLKRENVDVKQAQSINDMSAKKQSSGILGFLNKKKRS